MLKAVCKFLCLPARNFPRQETLQVPVQAVEAKSSFSAVGRAQTDDRGLVRRLVSDFAAGRTAA